MKAGRIDPSGGNGWQTTRSAMWLAVASLLLHWSAIGWGISKVL